VLPDLGVVQALRWAVREALRRDAHACLANAACRSGVQRATKSRPLLPHFGSDEGCRFPGSLASRCVLFALSSLANRTSSTRSTSRPTPPSGSLAHPPSSSFVQRGARRRRRLRLPPGSRATRLAPELDLRPRPALAWPAGCVSLARSSSHEDERGGATEPGRGPAGSRPPRPRGDQALTLTPALCAQDSLAGAASIWTRVRRAVPLAAPRCGRVAKLTSLLSASSSSSSSPPPPRPSPLDSPTAVGATARRCTPHSSQTRRSLTSAPASRPRRARLRPTGLLPPAATTTSTSTTSTTSPRPRARPRATATPPTRATRLATASKARRRSTRLHPRRRRRKRRPPASRPRSTPSSACTRTRTARRPPTPASRAPTTTASTTSSPSPAA